MKILGKVMMFVGVMVFFFGAGGMDSPSLFAPIMLVLLGIGLIYTGNRIDEEWT